MWTEPWKREDWVISRAGFRTLTWMFWAEIPFFLLTPFLCYVSILGLQGKSIPSISFPLQVVMSLIGASAAISTLALDSAMRAFEQRCRADGVKTRKIWRVGWIFPVIGAPPLYFWLVYRPQMQQSGFLRD